MTTGSFCDRPSPRAGALSASLLSCVVSAGLLTLMASASCSGSERVVPFSATSEEVLFAIVGTLHGHYEVEADTIRVTVADATLRHRDDLPKNQLEELVQITVGLGRELPTGPDAWAMDNESPPVPVHRLSRPGDQYRLGPLTFSMPKPKSLNLRKRWLIFALALRYEQSSGVVYIHSDRQIFAGEQGATDEPVAPSPVVVPHPARQRYRSTSSLVAAAGVWIGLIAVLTICQERWLRAPRPRYARRFALLAGLAWGLGTTILWSLLLPGWKISDSLVVSSLPSLIYAAMWFGLAKLTDWVTRGPGSRLWGYRILLPIMLGLPACFVYGLIFTAP